MINVNLSLVEALEKNLKIRFNAQVERKHDLNVDDYCVHPGESENAPK